MYLMCHSGESRDDGEGAGIGILGFCRSGVWFKNKEMKTFLAILMGISLGFCAVSGHAQAQGDFFEALYDVPVMPGLEELHDQAMLFDKPDGRIASVTAASKTLSAAQVAGFYGETLPQMGWKKMSENQYVREGDRLSLEITKKAPLTIVHFTLEPVKP